MSDTPPRWAKCRERGYHSMTQVSVASGRNMRTERVFQCEDCGWRTDEPKPWEAEAPPPAEDSQDGD